MSVILSKPMRLFLIAIASFLCSSGFIADGDNYHLQSIPEVSHRYKIYPQGIIAIPSNEIEIYVKPANDVLLKSKYRFMGLIPLGTSKPENSHPFIDWTYYRPSLEKNLRPNYFVIEVMLISSKEGFSFNPLNVSLNIHGNQVKANRYATVDTTRSSFYRSENSRPPEKGIGLIFSDDEREQAMQVSSKENKNILIQNSVGFVLFFDYPTPLPGKDSFEMFLHGLQHHGKSVTLEEIVFDSTQQLKVYVH